MTTITHTTDSYVSLKTHPKTVSYTVTIDSIEYFPSNVFISEVVDTSLLGDFEIILPRIESSIAMDDDVIIKRNGTTIFKGIVEKISEIRSDSGTTDFAVSGREQACLYAKRITGRELLQSKDPKEIIQTINDPGELIDIQPTKVTFLPTIDTWLDEEYSTETNCYDAALKTRRPTNNIRRYVLKFDLTDFFDKISSVNTSELSFYITYAYCEVATGYGHNIFRNTTDFNNSATWDDQPSIATSNTDYWFAAESPVEVWYTTDVTSDVEGWRADTFDNYGWMVKLDGESGGNADEFEYGARESAYPPELVVIPTYSAGSSTTASASLENASAWRAIDRCLTTYWSSLTGQLADQWFKVDLGTSYTLRRVAITMDQVNFAKNFKIEISTNDSDYDEVFSVTDNDANTVDVAFTAASARYVKLTITDTGTGNWTIFEMDFYEDGTALFTEGTLDTFGSNIDFRMDYEPRIRGLNTVSSIIDWEWWVDLDDKLNFQSQRGSDKTSSIIFKENLNLWAATKKRSIVNLARSVTVLGHGEGAEQIRKTKTTGSAVPEIAFQFKSIINSDALALIAQSILNEIDSESSEWEVTLKDVYESGQWGIGDTVKIYDSAGASHNLRVQRLIRIFSEESVEIVQAVFGSKIYCLPNLLQELLENIDHWANVDQSVIARSFYE